MKALNTKVTKINRAIKTATDDKNIAIHEALTIIATKVADLQGELNISERKAVKQLQSIIFAFDDKVTPEFKRVFKTVIVARIRKLNIVYDKCTLAQIENLCKHGTVNGVNSIDYNDPDAIRDYIKSLKTRVVETKTFPRKK